MGDLHTVGIKPLIAILRRATKSKYAQLLLNNRMLMQCYSIDQDDDIGLHYILHVPDTEEYVSEFWDSTLILEPKVLLSTYASGHKELLEVKKEKKLKPKEVREEALFKTTEHGAKLKFMYYVADEFLCSRTVHFEYPVKHNNPLVENVLSTYWNMMNMVKPGGLGVAFDAQQHGLHILGTSSPQVAYFKVIIGGKTVQIPLFKSMFVGRKDWREFYVSLQETIRPSVYLYTMHYTWGGITDQFVGYLLAF